MSKFFLAIAMFFSVSYGDTYAIIKADCQKKWGTNYKMIKYCVDKQNEALDYLATSNIDKEILSMCAKKWDMNFKMIKYCTDKQTEAKRSLGY